MRCPATGSPATEGRDARATLVWFSPGPPRWIRAGGQRLLFGEARPQVVVDVQLQMAFQFSHQFGILGTRAAQAEQPHLHRALSFGIMSPEAGPGSVPGWRSPVPSPVSPVQAAFCRRA